VRCRNCRTVMMETDPQCPSCHASAARATAPPPESTRRPSGLLLLLPIFGGAIGGALYAGLAVAAASETSVSSRGLSQAAGLRTIKRLLGLCFFLGGGLFLVFACVHFHGTWTLAQRVPTTATAADLCRKEYAASAPSWIVYTFADSKPTELTVMRRRLEHGGEVQAHCLLVRVDDKWLVATVAPAFEGNQLVGRLLPVDSSSSRSLIERVRKLDSNPSALLPYEFNAIDGSASDQRHRYMAAGWVACLGVLGLTLGLLLFRSRRPAPSNPASAAPGWTFHPPPSV
jgi:hypothetical protein